MSKDYNEFLDSMGLGGVTGSEEKKVKKGFTINRFKDSDSSDVLKIEGLFDEDGIDKEALKEEIGEELTKRVEEQVENILKKQGESKESKEQDIRALLEGMLKEQEEEKERRRLEFEESIEDFEGLDIQDLEKKYEEAVDNKKIIKKTRDKETNEVITEYKTDSGTTVIVNTGSVSNGKVSRWRYRFRKIRDTVSISILVVILLSVVYLYFNPDTAKEVGVLVDTQFVPWFKESILPYLGKAMENTIGEGIDNIIEWAKNR